MKIIGATFVEDCQARRARDRVVAEIALPNEPHMARAEAADRPGEGVTLLGIRVPDDRVGKVRAIIQATGGAVDSEVAETAIK
jgi:hypothetical protein